MKKLFALLLLASCTTVAQTPKPTMNLETAVFILTATPSYDVTDVIVLTISTPLPTATDYPPQPTYTPRPTYTDLPSATIQPTPSQEPSFTPHPERYQRPHPISTPRADGMAVVDFTEYTCFERYMYGIAIGNTFWIHDDMDSYLACIRSGGNP